MGQSRSNKKRSRRQGVLFEISGTDTSVYEKRFAERDIKVIAGVDEVGRGCLAGPVFAAAVILPYPCSIEGIKDSKKLSPKRREELFEKIGRFAVAVSYGMIEPAEIDEINILQATLKAMRLAIEGLKVRPEYLFVDGSRSVPINIPQIIIPKGDSRSISVAAASIMAKVTRDRMMTEMEKDFPGYSFSVHKGYGTALHLSEIRKQGTTKIHRMSFSYRSV